MLNRFELEAADDAAGRLLKSPTVVDGLLKSPAADAGKLFPKSPCDGEVEVLLCVNGACISDDLGGSAFLLSG